jgi:ribosomal protein L37AE/L43A
MIEPKQNRDFVYRCPCCGRKLAVGRIIKIRVKCPKCKKLVDLK